MFTGIDFEKAIDYYRKGKEVIVLDRASVGKNGKSGYDTFPFEELFKDLDFLVDVPAVINPDFEQAVQGMTEADQVDSEEIMSGVEFTCEFNDSILADEESERQQDRQDVSMGVMSLVEYRMKWYNEDEATAKSKIPEQNQVME